MKTNKGITLVALIITIIVMVILAGIIIVSAVADGGIIDRAQTAMKEQEQAEIDEIIMESYVYKTTASTNIYAELDMVETAKAIYKNLTSNNYTLLDARGVEMPEGLKEEQIVGRLLVEDIISLKIKGKHSQYIAKVDETGNRKIEDDITDGITISPSQLTLAPGTTSLLTVELIGNATGNVTFSSNKEEIATVDANGNITAIANGTATITAKCGKYTATCTVTVEGIEDNDITGLYYAFDKELSYLELKENDQCAMGQADSSSYYTYTGTYTYNESAKEIEMKLDNSSMSETIKFTYSNGIIIQETTSYDSVTGEISGTEIMIFGKKGINHLIVDDGIFVNEAANEYPAGIVKLICSNGIPAIAINGSSSSFGSDILYCIEYNGILHAISNSGQGVTVGSISGTKGSRIIVGNSNLGNLTFKELTESEEIDVTGLYYIMDKNKFSIELKSDNSCIMKQQSSSVSSEYTGTYNAIGGMIAASFSRQTSSGDFSTDTYIFNFTTIGSNKIITCTKENSGGIEMIIGATEGINDLLIEDCKFTNRALEGYPADYMQIQFKNGLISTGDGDSISSFEGYVMEYDNKLWIVDPDYGEAEELGKLTTDETGKTILIDTPIFKGAIFEKVTE